MAEVALSGLEVFGVALVEVGRTNPLAPSTALIAYRELGAVVRAAPFVRLAASDAKVAEYEEIIRTVFQNHPILPAPFGLMFRSAEQVLRWIEMNYIALVEGLHFVEGRCEARVHIIDTLEREQDQTLGDASTRAADCFRALQRAASAALPLRRQRDDQVVLSGAFLVEQIRWDEFVEEVSEQARRHGALQIDHSGPWPPYDFVRMDVRA